MLNMLISIHLALDFITLITFSLNIMQIIKDAHTFFCFSLCHPF